MQDFTFIISQFQLQVKTLLCDWGGVIPDLPSQDIVLDTPHWDSKRLRGWNGAEVTFELL